MEDNSRGCHSQNSSDTLHPAPQGCSCGGSCSCHSQSAVSSCSRTAMLLLCFFVGWLGIHRFYVGRWVSGLIWLFSLGVFGIGTTVDLILIVTGSFKDSEGKKVTKWDC